MEVKLCFFGVMTVLSVEATTEIGYSSQKDRACFAESQACGIFGAEEDIYIRKNLLDAGSCLLAGPEIGTIVDIKRDQGSLLFEFADTFDRKFLCVAAKT